MIDLRNVDAFEALVNMRDGSVDVTITDPPYDEHTHKAARTSKRDGYEKRAPRAQSNRNLDLRFDHFTAEDRERAAHELARVTRRWVLVFCCHEDSHRWADALATAGLDYVRTCVWVRKGAPQFTGDRPAQGHECIVVAHPKGKKSWNGGGKHGVYECPIVLNRGGRQERIHTTQKPLRLMEQLVRDFTEPGERVFDPFAGSGTTLVAAARLGRRALGFERDPDFYRAAVRRCEGVKEQRELFASVDYVAPEQLSLLDPAPGASDR